MRRVLVVLALLAFCTAGRAAPSTATSARIVPDGPGTLRVLLDGQDYKPKDYSAGPSGGVTVAETARGTLPSGKAVDFAVKRQIAAQTARAAMKAVAKNLVPGVGLAVDLWDALKEQGLERGPDGTAVKDPGQDKVEQGGVMLNPRTGVGYMTPEAVAQQEAAFNCSLASYGCAVLYARGSCAGECRYEWATRHYWPDGGIQAEFRSGGTGSEHRQLECPDAVGLPFHGRECPSNRRTPASPQDVEDAVERVPTVRIPSVVRDMANDGHPGIGTEPQPNVEGPSGVDDGTTITTGPDGTVRTRSRGWSFEYPPDGTIRYRPRDVETGPEGETTTEGEPEPYSPTDCDKYPDNIGCSKYGAPVSQEVPRSSRGVNIDPVALPGGSCPGDVSFTAFGLQHAFLMAPVCAAVTDYVRPLVLVLGGFLAVAVFVGGLKS